MKKKRPSNFFIMLIQLILLLLSTSKSHAGKGKENGGNPQTKPNIVFIVADDLGWDDVSFHGSPQIPTPNLDSLAMSGVILNNYYVSPSSFATKCEFMTGKYGTTLGVQHGVFHNKQPMGLPKKEKILPEYLKDLGYETHAVGKWGLGFHEERLLPWKRGFDTFFGALTSSSQDYFTHSAYDENYGLDLRRNEEIIHNATGYYATEMYTEEAVKVIKNAKDTAPFFLYVAHQAMHSGNADDPLQVPPCYLKKVPHIKNEKRKLYAGMVAALDESILNISIALSDRNLLENTIIIFTSDAGGAVGGMELNSGSNYPLRGSKMTVWEGGVRGVAFVYSEMIRDTARVSQEMFHSTDWVPTILRLVDANSVLSDKLDGFDIWASISNTKKISPRFEILHQFDPLQKNQCALRVGDYKLVINQDIGFYGDWYPRPSDVGELKNLTKPLLLPNAKVRCDRNYPHPFLEMHAPPCDPIKKPCLFNIQWDPCEFHNLAEFMPNTLKVLMDRLQYYRSSVTYPIYPKFDVKSDPEDSDGIWGPWTTSSNNNTSNNVKETQTNSASSPSASSPSVIALSAGPPTYTVSANSSELESVATKTQPINLDNHVDYSRPDEHEISALPSPPQETPTVQGNNTTTSIPAWTSELENKTQTPSPLYNVDIYGYKNDNQDINQAVGTKVKPEMNATFENVSNITPNHNENSTDNNQTQQTQAPPFLRNNNTENSNSILPTEVPTGAENRSFVDISMEIPQPKTVDNGVKQFSNNVFDIVADPNDYVGISVAHRNGSNEKSHEFATIADESVNHAEGSTKTDVDENLTHIHIHQNESSDNPMEFVVESNELTKKKNSSQLTSSVTDNALVYMDRNEHGQENKQIFTYESGPMSVPTSQSKSQMIELEKKPNATVAEAKNETNENVTTGKGKHAMPLPIQSAEATGSIKIKGIKGGKGFILSQAIAGRESLSHYNELEPNGTQISRVSKNRDYKPLGLKLDKVNFMPSSNRNPIIPPYPLSLTKSDHNKKHPSTSLSTTPPTPSTTPSPSKTKTTITTTTFSSTVNTVTTSTPTTVSLQVSKQEKTSSSNVLAGVPLYISTPERRPNKPDYLDSIPKAYKSRKEKPLQSILESPYLQEINAPYASPFIEIPEKENPKIASSELESLLPIPVAPNAIPSPNRKLTLLEDKVTSPYDMEENKEKNPSDEVSKMLPKTKEKSSEFKLPPAVSIQKAASLRPDGKKKPAPAGDAMSLKLGTGSDTATSSESSVGAEAGTLTAVESESKLPALQRPLILSALKNLADAGEKGKGGKQGMSSEVALVTGSYIGKGEGKKPVASNFIKEPEYSEITEPEYEKPQNPFAQSSESAKSGATSGAGATTESETVVGSLAETGSDTKIKSKTGPKLISGTKQITPAEETNAEAVGKAMKEVTSIEPVSIKHPSSFVKANKNYIGSSLKATSSHDPFDAEFSLGHGQHNDLPNPVIAGHRHFSSVADVVSDSSSQNCEKGRDCVPHQNILTEPDNKKELFGITGTQATSNLLPKSNRNSTLGEDMPQDTLLNQLPPVEKLHRFFGEIKVDDSKLFYISGTASEDKNLVVPSTASSTLISNENQATKHKIGFNVVLPSTILRQVPASAPQFKERSKVQNSTKTIKSRIGESPFAHSKTKYAIKKVFDMIADPARTRKTKVEVPSLEENIVTGKSNIEQPAAGGTGEAGDIGATKPLKGMLISLKPQPIISTINDTNDPDISKVMETSHNTESGDLGSIVTLVGKVDKDRSTSRRTKHNLTDESNAHKKTVNKDHMSLKHLPHNNSASETNAANVDHIQGPSNSIIVSSVIVVLVASFVVVGLAVVAIVAVVARHCRLGRHIEAS